MMLRNEDKKPDVPFINGQYIQDIISAYHQQKKEEANSRKIHIERRTSPTMRQLEQYYKLVLNQTTNPLTNREVLGLCKIIFNNNKDDGVKTKLLKETLLFSHFDERIVSAFDSAVLRTGSINALTDYFELICKNPENASTITYIALIIHDFIKEAPPQTLFMRDLFAKSTKDVSLCLDFFEVIRAQFNPAHFEIAKQHLNKPKLSLEEILHFDVSFYVHLKFYQAKKLSLNLMNVLKRCTYQELKEIANKIDVNDGNNVEMDSHLPHKEFSPLRPSQIAYTHLYAQPKPFHRMLTQAIDEKPSPRVLK